MLWIFLEFFLVFFYDGVGSGPVWVFWFNPIIVLFRSVKSCYG